MRGIAPTWAEAYEIRRARRRVAEAEGDYGRDRVTRANILGTMHEVKRAYWLEFIKFPSREGGCPERVNFDELEYDRGDPDHEAPIFDGRYAPDVEPDPWDLPADDYTDPDHVPF